MTRNAPRNRIDQVTTGRGDDGNTALADGRRYPKHHPRVDLVGALDEANSALGVLAAHVGANEWLEEAQSRLFDAGAAAATGGSAADWSGLAAELRARTQDLNATMPPLREFILPGGGLAAASAHMARAATRRAERAWWRAAEEHVALRATEIGVYLNRLGDLLFVYARALATSERQWRPLPNA